MNLRMFELFVIDVRTIIVLYISFYLDWNQIMHYATNPSGEPPHS